MQRTTRSVIKKKDLPAVAVSTLPVIEPHPIEVRKKIHFICTEVRNKRMDRNQRHHTFSSGSLRIDDFYKTAPLDCLTCLLRMPVWALTGVEPKLKTLVRAFCRRLGNSRT